MDATYHVCEIISKSNAKVLLFYEKAFSNRTNLLSNRTKVTDYITACGKIDGKTLLEIVMAVLERCLAGNLLEDAEESLVGRETA